MSKEMRGIIQNCCHNVVDTVVDTIVLVVTLSTDTFSDKIYSRANRRKVLIIVEFDLQFGVLQ
jgi:hypothetical protein